MEKKRWKQNLKRDKVCFISPPQNPDVENMIACCRARLGDASETCHSKFDPRRVILNLIHHASWAYNTNRDPHRVGSYKENR